MLIYECTVAASLPNCDHSIVKFSTTCDQQDMIPEDGVTGPVFEVRDYMKADYIKINEFLASVDWTLILCQYVNMDIDKMWSVFLDIVFIAVDCYVPKKNS